MTPASAPPRCPVCGEEMMRCACPDDWPAKQPWSEQAHARERTRSQRQRESDAARGRRCYDLARTVFCPQCSAEVGADCRSAGGRTLTHAHRSRFLLARDGPL